MEARGSFHAFAFTVTCRARGDPSPDRLHFHVPFGSLQPHWPLAGFLFNNPDSLGARTFALAASSPWQTPPPKGASCFPASPPQVFAPALPLDETCPEGLCETEPIPPSLSLTDAVTLAHSPPSNMDTRRANPSSGLLYVALF